MKIRTLIFFLLPCFLFFFFTAHCIADESTQVQTNKVLLGPVKDMKEIKKKEEKEIVKPSEAGASEREAAILEGRVMPPDNLSGYEITVENSVVSVPWNYQLKVGDTNRTVSTTLLKKGESYVKVTYGGDKNKVDELSLEKIKASTKNRSRSLIAALILTIAFFGLANAFFLIKKGGSIFTGLDKRYSNSKTQFAIWTFAVVFTYLAVAIERFLSRTETLNLSFWIGIPQNLVLLMGISVTSYVGAKVITSSKIQSKTLTKTESARGPSFVDLVTNDQKNIDLGDAQMFVWTLIGVGTYLALFWNQICYLDVADATLPNVDSSILALTGVSQVAYLGKKLVGKEQTDGSASASRF